MTQILMDFDWTRPMLAVARNSQTMIANLLKYAVHGIGSTKSPAATSLKPMLVYSLSC